MMIKVILVALSISVASGTLDMMRARKPSKIESCDVFLQRKCEENKSLVQYAINQPGKCGVKECTFKPKRGYTEHPERNHYIKFKPSAYSQKIIYAFKDIIGKACAIPNQMCSCKRASKCKCNSDNVKFCKQQYKSERGYFLVLKDAPQHTYPQQPEMHKPFAFPATPTYYHKPTPQQPSGPTYHHEPAPQQPSGPTYYQPHNSNTNTNQGQSDDQNNGVYSMARHYVGSGMPKPDSQASSQSSNMNPMFMQMMMQQMMGNTGGKGMSFLGGGDSDGIGEYMKYQYMMQAMNQQQHQPSYDHDHKEKAPQKQKPAKHGSMFNPTMLYYMMMHNKGSSSDGFLKMLPYLMGNGGMFGGRLELKSLWVKVPSGCDCEEVESKNSIWNLLPYFQQMQSYGSPMMPNHDSGSSSYPGFMGSMSQNPLYLYKMILSQSKN